MEMKIILASKSPRRKELLQKITQDFIVEEANIVESFDKNLPIEKIPESIAYHKAQFIQQKHPNDLIISADTIVVYENKILNKPKDYNEAFEMLSLLSNHTHRVITGVCILSSTKKMLFHSISKVTFYSLTEKEMNDYIATKSPFDKAGGYGIQDKAALFIKKLNGDYYNVMGLPIAKLNRYLKKFL